MLQGWNEALVASSPLKRSPNALQKIEFFDSIGQQRRIGDVRVMSDLPAITKHSLDNSVRYKRAMCGRLRVGKENLHVAGFGRCSHVFGLT